MAQVLSAITGEITSFFETEKWWYDALDILIVTLIIYEFIILVRRTRAAQLIKGIAIVVAAYFASGLLQLKTVTFIFQNVLQIGLLALIIVFQPEVRRALEQMGRGGFSFFSNRFVSDRFAMWHGAIVSICDSVQNMSDDRSGALIVIERSTGLDEIAGTGKLLNASITPELIETIFFNGSPLHDGAMIIENGRIKAAGCLLPLSSNIEISRDMGTRHRAGLGMSENSDALVIVVSEETGIISVIQGGIIIRRLDGANLFRILSNELMESSDEAESGKGKRRLLRRI
ncbi:MAG: diadenylate cyclase CdaA [Oscillospiraceae bacterium]|nr:diadenylate cyclase CdaA [Oscillospiraceae bacterium]